MNTLPEPSAPRTMRLHPIIHVAARQPQLLAEHARAYAGLALAEAKHAMLSVLVHAVLYAGAGVLGLFGILFAGVSLLLYGAGSGEPRHAWLLIAVPAVPLATALLCLTIARTLPLELPFVTLERQVKEDITMLHDARLP